MLERQNKLTRDLRTNVIDTATTGIIEVSRNRLYRETAEIEGPDLR
jgi:hypothetical protein